MAPIARSAAEKEREAYVPVLFVHANRAFIRTKSCPSEAGPRDRKAGNNGRKNVRRKKRRRANRLEATEAQSHSDDTGVKDSEAWKPRRATTTSASKRVEELFFAMG